MGSRPGGTTVVEADAVDAELINTTMVRYNSIMRRTTPRLQRGRFGPLFLMQLNPTTQRSMVWLLQVNPMLTGSDLLAKVKELSDVSKSDLVRSCGYVSSRKDGAERLNFTAFYEALLEAKGVSLGADAGGKGRGKGGRKLSHTTKVQFNGNLMVGKAYTAMLDLKPGDEFEIKLGRKQIRLIPAGASEEDEE